MTTDALARLTNVSVRRDSFELSIPEWEVPAGSVVGVVGANGAGKTTLLELLPGLRLCDKGRVEVLGHDPVAHPVEVRSQLGYMTDDMPIFNMRIHKLLYFLSGYYPTWDPGLAVKLLDRFELDPHAKVKKLSKGQATRIRLIIAMAFRPRLLVLDEPATGLDILGRRKLLQTVLDHMRSEGNSVIVSSHQLLDLERIADRLLVLKKGTIWADGSVDELVPAGRTLEELAIEWETVA